MFGWILALLTAEEMKEEIIQEVKNTEIGTCKWEKEKWDDYWNSECGDTWSFSGHYGPKDNHMKFCCYCGKPLEEVR